MWTNRLIMKRILLFLLSSLFLLFPAPSVAEYASPEAVQWATDFLKACQERRLDDAKAMMANPIRLGVRPTEQGEVFRQLADFLKEQKPELIFSHRASGGVHGAIFKTSKGEITVAVYRSEGVWGVTSVKF